MIRRHSGSASEPSAQRGVAQQRHPLHALGVALGEVADQPDDDAGRVGRRRAVDRHQARSCVVEVVLDERAGGLPGSARSSPPGASSLTISAGCSSPRRRAVTIRCAPSSSGCSGSLGGASTSTTTPWPGRGEQAQHAIALGAVGLAQPAADQHHLDAEAGRSTAPCGRRSRGSPPASGRSPARRAGGCGSTGAGGSACGGPGSGGFPRAPRRASARARAARPPGRRRRARGVRSRTSASANSRSSFGVRARDAVEQVDVLGTGQPVERELATAAPAAGGATSSDAARGAPRPRPARRQPGRNVSGRHRRQCRVRRRAPSRRRRPGACTAAARRRPAVPRTRSASSAGRAASSARDVEVRDGQLTGGQRRGPGGDGAQRRRAARQGPRSTSRGAAAALRGGSGR